MKRYIVMVYDCSFVQDYVVGYEKTFDTESEAKAYAISIMDDFAYAGLYEYSAEIGIYCGMGQYNVFGFWEFEAMGDIDYDNILDYSGEYSYHEMF